MEIKGGEDTFLCPAANLAKLHTVQGALWGEEKKRTVKIFDICLTSQKICLRAEKSHPFSLVLKSIQFKSVFRVPGHVQADSKDC